MRRVLAAAMVGQLVQSGVLVADDGAEPVRPHRRAEPAPAPPADSDSRQVRRAKARAAAKGRAA